MILDKPPENRHKAAHLSPKRRCTQASSYFFFPGRHFSGMEVSGEKRRYVLFLRKTSEETVVHVREDTCVITILTNVREKKYKVS